MAEAILCQLDIIAPWYGVAWLESVTDSSHDEKRKAYCSIIYRIYSLISRTFLPGIWPVFCLRLIPATYPAGQSFRMFVRDDTHDTDEEDEDDTYDDLPYL